MLVIQQAPLTPPVQTPASQPTGTPSYHTRSHRQEGKAAKSHLAWLLSLRAPHEPAEPKAPDKAGAIQQTAAKYPPGIWRQAAAYTPRPNARPPWSAAYRSACSTPQKRVLPAINRRSALHLHNRQQSYHFPSQKAFLYEIPSPALRQSAG